MEQSHFFLHDGAAIPIEYKTAGGGGSSVPERNIQTHAAIIRQQYENSLAASKRKLDERREADKPAADGVYLDFELKGDDLPYESLDAKQGAHLLAVNSGDAEDTKIASLFLPEKNSSWLSKKLDKYQEPVVEGKNPHNMKLINSVETVSSSTARSLFPDKEEYDGLQPNDAKYFEVWLDVVDDEEIDKSKRILSQLGIEMVQDEPLKFEHVTVLLVKATKEAIDDIPFSLDYVEAIRLYYNPAEMLDNDADQREWEELIEDDIINNVTNDSVIVGLLDMGVNNGHPLLQPFLPDDRRATVLPHANVEHEGDHGTGMAGLLEYGDLADFMGRREHLEINHALASVKMMSDRHPNDKKLYGLVTSDAIAKAEEFGAQITCMAITAKKERNDGSPSSWSAAIDKALFNHGECNRLMLISAGNTKTEHVDASDYVNSLVYSSIQSPCESMNALVVGAYTRRCVCQKEGYTPIAPPDGISPHTRTSFLWRHKTIKPDIVMEGGNVGHHSLLKNSDLEEMSLVTTNDDWNQKPFQHFNGTSASTALAARLAARVLSANPNLSMLSIRALIVHSASWTDEMRKLDPKTENRMKFCGYGVPDESKAMASGDTYATFIVENELVPFKEDGTYNQMHVYALPWPKKVLLQMDAESVKMRVTLSYYIEPSPSFKTDFDKYRLASARLAFDIKTPRETHEQFIARNNMNQTVSIRSKNDSERWAIGSTLRGNSTIQSDWFEGTARELAECNEIAIFPRSGWWKFRKIANVHNRIKYSLVVSIETEKTEIYDAIRVAVEQAVPIAVEN